MRGQQVLFSHDKDSWETPQWLFDELNQEFHFNLDLCASMENTKCSFFLTEEDDSLHLGWNVHDYKTIAFCNPPYSQWQKFAEKAWVETHVLNTPVEVVMLLPARTDTKAFHNFIYNQPNVEIRFLKGRLKFELGGQPVLDKKGKPQSAPFPSMVVIFKQRKDLSGSQV